MYLLYGGNLADALQSLAAAVCGGAACVIATEVKANMLQLYGAVCAAGLLYDAAPCIYHLFTSRNMMVLHRHEVTLVSLLVPLFFVAGIAISMKLYSQLSEADSERLPFCQADNSVDNRKDAESTCEEAPFKTLLALPMPRYSS
eukprot:TRINITY_DN10613_c0_g1_i2.p1 TRINITY_DN10613_c0_g1~~TRINITY_DN10613_c0_g1_i2.p1  ORF type:complete len:144 (+),score=27.09 TRINITY_DN10613_c0_g1_i2:224-655(+)